VRTGRRGDDCDFVVKMRSKRSSCAAQRRALSAQHLVVPFVGVQLKIGITKGLLTLPQDSTPVICIGPGTGVAPARVVVEARVHLGMKDNTLYFGHRASGKDEHYAQEWISLTESGHLTYPVTASRDGPEGTPRVYVQDLTRSRVRAYVEV
jgi:sulfite reductase alpha subunit-like flavoprotein